MGKYFEEAMRILAREGMCHQRTGGDIYTVRMGSTLLQSEDTGDLREQIERELRRRAKRSK